MSRILTILGIIYAVAFAVASDVADFNPRLSRYLMLIGVAAAAAGQQLVTPETIKRHSRKLKMAALLIFCVALLTLNTACGDVGSKVVKGADKADRVVTELRDGDLIEQSDADRLTPLIGDVRKAGEALAIVERAVKSSRESEASKKERVRVATQAVINSIQKLNSEGVLKIKNAAAQKRLAQALALIQIALEVT